MKSEKSQVKKQIYTSMNENFFFTNKICAKYTKLLEKHFLHEFCVHIFSSRLYLINITYFYYGLKRGPLNNNFEMFIRVMTY